MTSSAGEHAAGDGDNIALGPEFAVSLVRVGQAQHVLVLREFLDKVEMEHDRGIGQHELEVVYHVDGARIALFGRFHHGAAHDLLKADRDHLVDLAGFLGRGLDLA